MPRKHLAFLCSLLALFFFSYGKNGAMACSGDAPCAVGYEWSGEPTGENTT